MFASENWWLNFPFGAKGLVFRGDFLLVLGSVFPFQVETSPHTFWCIYIYTLYIYRIPRPSKKKSTPKNVGITTDSLVCWWIGLTLAWHCPATQGSMDLLLGPSSWDFRMAAAQVAEEFSMPLLLWSFPESLGMGWVMPSNTMAPWICKSAKKIHGKFFKGGVYFDGFRVFLQGWQGGFSCTVFLCDFLFISTCRMGLWGVSRGRLWTSICSNQICFFSLLSFIWCDETQPNLLVDETTQPLRMAHGNAELAWFMTNGLYIDLMKLWSLVDFPPLHLFGKEKAR